MTQLLTSDSYIPTTSGAVTLPSITNNGDGSVTVGTGVFYLHDAYPGESHVNRYTIAGATFTLVDGYNNYIYADYNSGTPHLKQTIDRTSFVNTTTTTPVYTVYRNGTSLTILDWDTAGCSLPEKLLLRTINNKRFERDETIGGLVLADSGSLHFTISAGTIWYGVNNQALTAVDSAVDTVKRYLWNGTAWTSSAVTTFENTYYQGPSGLVAVSTARYCITWVYRSVQSGKVAYTLLGTADYKLAEAQAAPAPSNVPPEISSTCVLVGRIIVAKSATTATEVDSAFITPFASAGGTGTTNHNDLAGRDATGCHPASSIANTPSGNIAATTVQAALNELDAEKAALAGAAFTGGVTAPSFDSATLNLGTSTATQINLGTASTTQTVNIGTGSGVTTINLGGAGDTVNVSGTLAYVNVTNMTVTDKLITLNKGGGASTGFSSGFEIEENSTITGFCRSTSDNASWEIKAPGSSGILTLSPGSSNASVVLSTDSRLTDSRPASDVYAWAKAAVKPAYTYSEVGASAATHAHAVGDLPTGTMVNRGTLAQASVDTAVDPGFWNITRTGDSVSLLTWNTGGSVGPFQLWAEYSGVLRFRNKTGSTTWTGWKSIWHTGNFDPASKADAATAITTSNIGSQSVSYASSAGNASNSAAIGGIGGWSTNAWAGVYGYPGYTLAGGNTRFGFSSPDGICDVYCDGNFYAGDAGYPVWHSGNFDPGTKADKSNTGTISSCSTVSNCYPHQAAFEVRETNRGGNTLSAIGDGPTIGFHWAGWDWNHLVMDAGGVLNYMNYNRTSWKPFKAESITATGQFNGSGAGLTGTAANLSIGGNAATATTATNLSGGSVSATTGSFSGVLTAPTAAAGTNTTQVATTAFVQAAIAAAGGGMANNTTTIIGTECTTYKTIHSGTATVYGVIVTNTTSSARYFKLSSTNDASASRIYLKIEVPAGQTVSLFPNGGFPATSGGYSGINAFCTTGSSDTDTTYASSGDMFATILWS